MPMYKRIEGWGTLFKVPHRFPIHSPLQVAKDIEPIIWAHRDAEWGIYGEYVGNLGWGSPSPNPFVHRRSGRFVGNLRKNAFS